MAFGDDADIRFRIRGQDDGALRLLAQFQRALRKAASDAKLFRTQGQIQGDKGFMSKADSARVVAADKLRQVQNAAHVEDLRRTSSANRAQRASEGARLAGIARISRAENQAHGENARRVGQANVANQRYQQAQLSFQRRINAAHTTALRENARRGAAGGGRSVADMDREGAGWGRLLKSVLAYYAARQAGRLFVGFIKEGLQFNQVLETATLGISSLITATSKVVTGNGTILEGAEALGGAYKLAADQMQKLRIAGLQTAATTEQLVDAFQQAVGPGLKAGLGLDQIRQLTIQIVQAAGAIGVPLNQLNQEVRSILDNTIDRNSRVARVLGITNEQVRLAKEQNKLAEFLNEKLRSFTIAGERAAQTMMVVKSNIMEAIQVFTGQATLPLFEKMRQAFVNVLADAFDFKNARISDKFQGLIGLFQEMFSSSGELLATMLEKGITGAQNLGVWFDKNKASVQETVEAFTELVKQSAGLLADLIGVAAKLLGIQTTTGGLAGSLNTLSSIIKTARDNMWLLIAGFVAAKAGVLLFTAEGAKGMAALSVHMTTLSKHPLLVKFALLGLAITGWLALLNLFEARTAQATRSTVNLQAEQVRLAKESAAVNIEYLKASEALDAAKKGTDEHKAALERLRVAYGKLMGLSPDIISNAMLEKEARKEVTKAAQDETRAMLNLLHLQLAMAQADDAAAQAGMKATTTGYKGLANQIAAPFGTTEFEKWEQQAIVAGARIEAINAALKELRLLGKDGGVPTLVTTPPGASDSKKRAAAAARQADLKQKLAADLKLVADAEAEKLAIVSESLAEEDITFQQAQDERTRIITESYDERIKLENTIIPLLTDETDQYTHINAVLGFILDKSKELSRIRKETAKQEAKDEKARVKAQVEGVKNDIDAAELRMQQMETNVNGQIQAGRISTGTGVRRLREGYNAEILALRELQKEAQGWNLTAKQMQQVNEQLEIGIFRLEKASTELRDELQQIADVAIDSMVKGVEELLMSFDEMVSGTKSVGEAFRDMARSIIADIQRIISRMIAMRIVEFGMNLIPGMGGGASAGTQVGTTQGITRAASGGYILGPGTSTSDSIPARLSAGEYVLNARAVKRFGVGNLDAINYGALGARARGRGIPRGYAAGGSVVPIGGGEMSARLGLEDGLVLRHLDTTEGQRWLVESIRKNKSAVRSIVGR